MTLTLETIYFGRLPRVGFFLALLFLTSGLGLLLAYVVWLAGDGAGAAMSALLEAPGRLVFLPRMLHEGGVADLHAGTIVALTWLYLILATFLIAARARDCGLWGWASTLAVYAVFAAASLGDPWVASLAPLVMGFLFLWPSREEG